LPAGNSSAVTSNAWPSRNSGCERDLRANTLAHAKEVFVTISALRAGDDQRSQPEKERPSFVRLAQSGRLGFARAVPLRVGLDVRMERPGYDPFPQRDLGWCSYALLRPTIERTVRSRVEGQPNTTLRQRCRVQEVLATPNGEAVTGVRYENANDAPACGDGRSVVLASGRMFTVPAPINFEFETNEKRSNRSPVSPQQFLYCSFISSPTTTKAPKTSAEPISDFRLANRATKLCFFCPPPPELEGRQHRTIKAGREGWEQIAKSGSFPGWVAVGKALAVGRDFALRVGFAGTQKSVRSVAIELAENVEAIEQWRSTLPERQRRRLTHPLSNVRPWRASTLHGNGRCPQDLKRDAVAAWARFCACTEALPADQAAPLWRAVAAEASPAEL
jgi:hypothetical protein